MSILKNNKVIAVGDVNINNYHPPILSNMWSDHLLNDIQWLRGDTFSWQDGDVYKTAYDKLVEEYNNPDDYLEADTNILDSDYSSLAQKDYVCNVPEDGAIKLKYSIQGGSNFTLKIITGDNITSDQGILGARESIAIKNGYLGYYNGSSEFVGVTQILANTTYYIKSVATHTYCLVYYSLNNLDWELIPISDITDTIYIGKGVAEKSKMATFRGSIDLKECTLNGNKFIKYHSQETEGNITFKRTSNEFKIATADQEQAILDKYNSDGIAWYYILDTTNKRFKLPRTKWGFKGLRDNVGNDIEQNVLLPDITGVTGAGSGTGSKVTGAFYSISGGISGEKGGSGGSDDKIGFSAARCSGVYSGDGTNTLIDERATQMYLYFYVGEYNQTAIEQTAGLSDELLSEKLDLDVQKLTIQGKSLISGLGMPSSNYTTLTLGASGSTYTAPANGYFVLNKISGASGKYVNLINETIPIKSEYLSNSTTNNCSVYIPAKKGDIVKCSYNLTGATNYFRFVYAEGAL